MAHAQKFQKPLRCCISKMAGALRSCGSLRSNDSSISLLVVASSELCEKISSALHQSARENKCRIVVHQCEFITEVLRLKLNLAVDFIVFAIDGQVSQSVTEVETNIGSVDEHYIISGYACLVYCHGASSNPSVTYYRAKQIADKYRLRRFLTVNIHDPANCILLGNRLLNLSEGILGLKCGLATIDTCIDFN